MKRGTGVGVSTFGGLLGLLFTLGPALALAAQEAPTYITFFDVGQGDAVLITSPEGKRALVDAGPGVDLTSALGRWGVDSLDLVIASHPHADHIGGMLQVLESIPVRFYMDNGQPHTTTTYYSVMTTLRARPEITYLEAVPRSLQLGSVTLHVLPMPANPGSKLNNRSVGIVVEYGSFLAFLSGDSERRELQFFVQAGVVPDVTLLKAPHHGSDNGVTESFLQAADPEIVVISVGGNDYGHPKPAALHAYGRYADQVLRTDRDGEVAVAGYSDGRYEVFTRGESAAQGMGRSSPFPIPPEARAGDEATPLGPEEPSTAMAGSIEVYVFADAPGNDHNNPNGEYAVLTNRTDAPLDISRWTLCDAARHCFTFPDGAQVAGEGQVVVFTGSGRSDGARFFMQSGSAVWNNNGDTATLVDASGRVMARYVY